MGLHTMRRWRLTWLCFKSHQMSIGCVQDAEMVCIQHVSTTQLDSCTHSFGPLLSCFQLAQDHTCPVCRMRPKMQTSWRMKA